MHFATGKGLLGFQPSSVTVPAGCPHKLFSQHHVLFCSPLAAADAHHSLLQHPLCDGGSVSGSTWLRLVKRECALKMARKSAGGGGRRERNAGTFQDAIIHEISWGRPAPYCTNRIKRFETFLSQVSWRDTLGNVSTPLWVYPRPTLGWYMWPTLAQSCPESAVKCFWHSIDKGSCVGPAMPG